MARLKIISNPYKKEIRYQKWNEGCENWAEINTSSCPNSKLLKKELTTGFFPFCVNRIIDAIYEEYYADGEAIELVFEGTADEFRELVEACKCSGIDQITAVCSEIILENARDILPQVREIFREKIDPIIVQSVDETDELRENLDRFTDASSDVVPVCVLGNYSAGKSTFINALIGSEILPSGIEPTTAKVSKISRSSANDSAMIRYQYLGEITQDIVIQFSENQTSIVGDNIDNVLTTELMETLTTMNNETIPVRVNKALAMINDYENSTPEHTYISDLIEVEVPFADGVLSRSQFPVVIFDTPGSNSASNNKHLPVLKQAMENMTNGLPVFLSTPDTLDSNDGEKLSIILSEMEEQLDRRFTMIVVNKADGPGLQRKETNASEEKRVLSQAIPRLLYSGGLFYVSSILGLGSKNDGEFSDEFYEETYDDQVHKYRDPSDRRYKCLYHYNIMPGQLKKYAVACAAAETDLVYANSGLFSVEFEIENFSGKYSAYNKCDQSRKFLKKVIEITSDEIDQKKKQCENERSEIENQLESDKKELNDVLKSCAYEEEKQADISYTAFMSGVLSDNDSAFSNAELSTAFSDIRDVYEVQYGYKDLQGDAMRYVCDVGENLKDKFNGASSKFSMSALRSMAGGLISDVSAAREALKVQKETKRKIMKETTDDFMHRMAVEYDSRMNMAHYRIDQESRKYWAEETEKIRNMLATIVTGSEVLTDERRQELERVIITYGKLLLPESESGKIFDREKFEYKIKVFDKVIWQAEALNIDKISKIANENFAEGVKTGYDFISESHTQSAHIWVSSLLDEIFGNIVKYSPELSRKAEEIRKKTEQINGWAYRKAKLDEYTRLLDDLMEWKTV